MNIQAALDRFLVQLEANGRSLHTRKQYRRHIRSFARWLDAIEEVGKITPDHIASFLASPAARTAPDGHIKKASSMNSLRTSLRVFHAYLHEAGIIPTNPARLVRPANCSPPPPRGLSPDEQARLLEAITDKRDRALFGVMLMTGIRVGAAVRLMVEDVDLDSGWLAIRTKGDRGDRLPLSARAVAVLREWIGGRATGPLWGRELTVRHVQRRLARWMQRADVRGSPHALRHSFALGLYRRCGDVLVVQKALGHRSIASTLVYARADDRRLREILDG